MAYTIISQNNSTTTLSDGVNTITVPSRVNLTSGNFTIVEVNNNMATLEDGDGNVYRDIPCVATLAGEGGGGGSGLPDQTGHSGEFLTTDGTDASWAAVDALPDQTGQSGKFLTTDGTDASWTTINAMSNSATDGQSIAALASDYVRNLISITGNKSYVFGAENYNGIQHSTLSGDGIVLIGGKIQSNTNISTKNWTVLNGYTALDSYVNVPGEFSLSVYGIAKGTRSIQLGLGTNSDANTLKVGVTSGNYEIMSADGTIPTARLTKVNSAITLTAAGWSSNTQTVSVTGMTATGIVFVSPDPTDQSAYTSAGIICSAQAAGTLTFTCSTTPTADLSVNVVML